jgi:uncharacterized zinc-type alcohol dehydrogenase-like protein
LYQLNKTKKIWKQLTRSIRCGNSIKAFTFERKELGEKEVQIEILYSGVCHSDIYTVKGIGDRPFSISSGHEIVGKVTAVGSAVSKFKVGEIAGVGCFVDSCRTCKSCKAGDEQLWWRNDRDL